MADGGNRGGRSTFKEGVEEFGKGIQEGAEELGKGIQHLAVGIGRGVKNVTVGTVDAILKPQTIPEKLEHAFDVVAVQPTKRTFDFLQESTHTIISETDKGFQQRIKHAQKGAHRLKVVFAAPLQDITGVSFIAKQFHKAEEDNMLIENALKDNFVFAHLSPSKRANLIGAFEPKLIKKGMRIIKQGDVGDYFYVIGKGKVSFRVSGKDVGSAGAGQTFGELALLYQAPRAATCVAQTDCSLFRLDQETFRRILMQQIQDQNDDVIKILKQVSYFKDLDDLYLNKIACNLKIAKFEDGEVLVRRGEEIKMFFIIKEGKVRVTDIKAGGSTYKDITFGPGQFFGDSAIVDDAPALGTVKAVGSVTALNLNREVFARVLGTDLEKLVNRTVDKRKLKYIPFGRRKGPADNELDLLAASIVEKKYRRGHTFFTEGQRCVPALYLIRKGEVSIRSSSVPELEALLGFSVGKGNVQTIKPGGYFGNDTLGNNETGQFGVAKYTVQAIEDVKVGVLDLDAIRSVVVARDKTEDSINIEDLNMVRILGAGTFGKVWLVSRKDTKEAYALKVQVKKQLIEYNQAEGVIREKKIMTMLDYPFIIKLVSSYKDEEKLYMLMKLYQGGELQTIIHTDSRDGIPEWAAKFYAANIIDALSYMHHRHIIYRDLKPENVLLDNDGYTVIVDLGFAKVIKDKTYTFCGTPLYLAPEIIMQRGHDKGADHWSWGVMLYEMIIGMTPFYDGIVDQMGLFKNIVRGQFEFPVGDIMSSDSRDLIKRMLVVNPAERLGSFASADKDIRAHPFFDSIDWKALVRKKTKVPFKPKVSDPLDGSNFDDYSKLELDEKHAKHAKLTPQEERIFDKF